MKKIPILIIILSVVFIKMSWAQDALTYVADSKKGHAENAITTPKSFEFIGYPHEYELDNITIEMAGEHLFGELIAKKLYLLDSKYTSEVALIPGNPQTKTVIQKPAIYNTVKRIEKYLKRAVKKGELTTESATYTFIKVLEVALSIVTADTKSFEAVIGASDSETAKIDLFTKSVNLIY
jgi:hypothetical protein